MLRSQYQPACFFRVFCQESACFTCGLQFGSVMEEWQCDNLSLLITRCRIRLMVRANQLLSGLNPSLRGSVRAALLVSALLPASAMALDLQPYPAASVNSRVSEDRTNHPIVSSPMKKVNGVVLADEMQRLDGALQRRVYQLPAGHESNDGYEFFVQQLKTQNVEPLFTCNSFSCGDSNFWANNIFRVSTLYGMGKEQHYFVGKKVMSDKVVYYTVYSVKRGNRRVYTLIDEFTVDSNALAEDNQGARVYYIDRLPGTATQLSRNNNYREVVEVLQANDSRQLLMNIELPLNLAAGIKGVDEQMDRQQQVQTLLQEQLQADGIPADRYRTVSSYSTSSSRQPGIRFLLLQ